MASLSSSWRPAVSSASRLHSPVDSQAPSSISRPSSPSPEAGESATTIAWRNALNSYRKSLSEKDFKRIMIPAGPQDVANEVEKWQCRQSASRYARVAAAVRAGVGRMQRFSASIDMLAQGSPSPGCLLWGSIKFVLTIVQDAAEEYEKLCQALSRMVDCLPQIEIYTDTFLDSEIVRACVGAFYISTLRFWTRACKFYRRHRLLNFIRVVWNDFDAEFGELEVNMIQNRERVEKAALAEHIGQSKVSRTRQQLVNQKLLEAQDSAREKEITAWLSPAAYDVKYYQNDLANARALRHPKTCQWIFAKDEMRHLFGDTLIDPAGQANEESFLWIYAKPGAGKTILSSRLIDHYILEKDTFQKGHVLYFFCKSTDADKNNATAVVRSLLYQLYKSIKDPETLMRLTADMEQALEKSGKRQAVDFAPLWANFANSVKCTSPILIVLDALDECQDSEQLIHGLKSILFSDLVKIVVTSRKEAHLFTQMSNDLSFEIIAEDINSDIVAYVESKVMGSPRLSHTLVRDPVIARLSMGHSGMFLWVYLMLKELKSCFSVAQVQGVLENLPQGLDGIYENILQRLRDNLPTASLDLCYKVLTWVVSAVRPLKIDELKHALSLHHEIEGDQLLFEYAEKDIELICGSLVTVRQGTLQVIHLTVKEFLTSTHRPRHSTYSDLLIDPAKANLALTLACLKCIQSHCNESFVSLDPKIARLDRKLDVEAVVERQRQAPLAEYASFTWMVHLTECDGSQMIGVSKAFQKTFDSPSTFHWVEACMAFNPDSVLHLIAGLEEVNEYISGLGPDQWQESEASCVFIADWCHALRNTFEEYGTILSRRPWEVHLLDLQSSFSVNKQFYEKFSVTSRRDTTLRITGYKSPRSCRPEPQAHSRLQDLQGGLWFESIIFFIHDERRALYFWGERLTDLSSVRLFVQNATTGQRLAPAVNLDGGARREGSLYSYGLSPSGEFIVVVYSIMTMNAISKEEYLTLIWQVNEGMRFKKRMRSESWARIVFSHQCGSALEDSIMNVTFPDRDHCLTPSGKIHLASGSRRPLLDPLPNRHDTNERRTRGIFYCQNGKYCFISEKAYDGVSWIRRAVRVELCTEMSERLCSWKESSRHLVDVSPSGRFLVLSIDQVGRGKGEAFLCLYDVDTSETIQLPFVERLDYLVAKYQFAKDEMELIVFISCRIRGVSTMNVLVWGDLQTDPVLRTYGKLNLDHEISPSHIHVNSDASSALLVLEKRIIQRVEFGTRVEFPGAPDVDYDYPRILTQASRDGVRTALLEYGKEKARLQVTELSSEKGLIHRLDLQLSPCDEPDSRVVRFSPNLNLLVVDAQIFPIAEGLHGLSSTSFTTPGLSELLMRHRARLQRFHYCQLHCLISPCNSYIMFISPGDPDAREANPPTLYAFRLDLASRSSARLDLQLPKDLGFISADLHPSQPLMLLTYSTFAKPDVRVLGESPLLQVCIVEFESLEMKPVVLPKSRSFMQRMNNYWKARSPPPRAKFSDCGRFVLMAPNSMLNTLPYVIHELDTNPVASRFYVLHPHGFPQPRDHLTPSGEYRIEPEEVDRTSYRLVSAKLPKDDPSGEGSDVASQSQGRQRVHIDNILFYSSQLADGDRYLLLGENDDEKMRLLIAPRKGSALEITTLSLTFNEAKRRLEIEWEKRQALEKGKGE